MFGVRIFGMLTFTATILNCLVASAELPNALEIIEEGKELDKRIFEDKPNSLSWKGYYIYDDEFYVCIIYNFDTNHLLECVPIMVVPTAERDYRK